MAKGLNIFTGVERTPAALRWMLNQRMYLHGEIVKLEKLVADAPARLATLRAKLSAVDETIRLHDLHVDLGQLPPRQRKTAIRVALPYGALAKTIWATLRKNGNQPLKTSRFTQALIVAYEVPVDKETMHALRQMMTSALNGMVRKGHLRRLHSGVGPGEGIWALTEYGNEHVPRAKRSYRGAHAALAAAERSSNQTTTALTVPPVCSGNV
ncbi:MAG: hypothetical protein U1F15_02765 [Burkholderiales bacterium]